MASYTLYPPIVDSSMPAFNANGSCRVYFSLSKFNSSSDIGTVQVSIVKQSTGMNVVKLEDNTESEQKRYRTTGIILDLRPGVVQGENNLYYVDLINDDLSSIVGDKQGWIPGWVYKIQLRLTAAGCSYQETGIPEGKGQSKWLDDNSNNFSEWSTVCIVKATGKIDYTIYSDSGDLGINTANDNEGSIEDETKVITLSFLNLMGHFTREDKTELIYTYQFILYDENNNILEDSGPIYSNKSQDSDDIHYLMKTELKNGDSYKLAFKYETINHMEGGFYYWDEDIDKRLNFVVSQVIIDEIDCRILTAENDSDNILKDVTSIGDEEDEGRIGLKLYRRDDNPYSGNICIRRSDSRTNFQVWEDIKIFVAREDNINSLPMIYDYTVESGVWYKYGVLKIDTNGNRGIMRVVANPIMRNFSYSYLLGPNNQQLKLMFDNTMNSFKHQIVESKVDPIGAQFPVVTRNAATNYKTFPVTGLISFWMDENQLFCDKKVIYKYNDVVDLYKEYDEDGVLLAQDQYDYIYERDFRQKVLEFLYNGEVKLFKSPTEGNVIVRLTDISCVPNQSLDRMIYSFSANAHEMAEPTMANYKLYNFYDPGNWSKDFSVYSTHLGQIQMEVPVGANIFTIIKNKYSSNGQNLGGYTKVVGNIRLLKICFDGKPLRISSTSVGNIFSIDGKSFTVLGNVGEYNFDERLIYTTNSSFTLSGEVVSSDIQDTKNPVTSIPVTIDFLYDIKSEVYEGKKILTRSVTTNIGQLFNEYIPNTNLYNKIYYKYYIEWDGIFRRLNNISSIEIEANPGALFYIKDQDDDTEELHEIGTTGLLSFYELSNIVSIKYAGMRLPDGSIDTTKKADILMNYIYSVVKGTYQRNTTEA